MKYHLTLIYLLGTSSFYSYAQSLKPINYADITIGGELGARAQKNFDRLETDIYSPAKVFPVNKSNGMVEWPGDMEGRIMLGLIVEAQATHRDPKYLEEMIKVLPDHVNEKGYFGPVEKDTIIEQQLSGNGWYLRALCEYYNWKKDPKVKIYVQNVINNLALLTLGYHKKYPLDPASRKKDVGAASGTTQATVGNWALSSDVGCDFIFMDGVVQAYGIVPSVKLKNLIDEMIARFLQMDLKAINAQTHATLTGTRAMLRYYNLTKQPYLLEEARKRYDLYRLNAMTANFENFNWFGRPEWTEPCAIVDSYMVAMQLWQFTNQSVYLEDAHHIYYNAIANTQRANGGFGLSNCPIPGNNVLKVNTDEAWWCCTMRGAEGLTTAVRNNYFVVLNTLVIPFFNNSTATIHVGGKMFTITQKSNYPFEGKVTFEVEKSNTALPVVVKLAAPSWTTSHKLMINSLSVPFIKRDGFLVFKTRMSTGDKISLDFNMDTQILHMVNAAYSKPDVYTISYGPLLLGVDANKTSGVSFLTTPSVIRIAEKKWKVEGQDIELSPVYQLLNPEVNKKSGYAKQILFKIGNMK